MPTVLQILGWRLYFYANEGNEPMHIHCRKGGAECKFWLRPEVFEIEEAYQYGLTPAMRRDIRKIIFEHLDVLAEAWFEWERQRNAGN